jgi:hypothetical protein
MPTDTAVSRALARKEVLQREIETHQREIESRQTEMHDVETFLSLYARFSGEGALRSDASEVKRAEPGRASAANAERPSGNGPISQDQFEADTRKLLIENERPMKRGQLIKSFHSRGLRVGGSDEVKNFGTKIWKAKGRFINIAGEGYWPRDIACPVVGYEPSGNPDAGLGDLAGHGQDGLFSKPGRAA